MDIIATLKDVAKKANVSKMTVSRVINHPQLVTDELKQLVYQAMEELNYRPNMAAKALAQNRTLIVKVLILEEMDATEPYYMNLLSGIAKGLDKYQYSLQLMTENTIDTGNSDGYIITGMRESDYEWIRKIDKPLILYGENTYGVPFVDSDNRQAEFKATEYAFKKGYDHIVFVGIDVPEYFERQREQGYQDALAQHPDHTAQIHRIRNSSTAAAELVERLDAHLEPNTCFVCASDRIALGIQRGLKSLGKSMPDDVGVIGFDGVFLDQIASPQLTTMKQKVLDMGIACVEQLMRLIEGESLKERACYFEADLVERGSTRL